MEQKLLLGALGVGVVGWVGSLLAVLMRGPKPPVADQTPLIQALETQARRAERSFGWSAFLLPLLVWLLSLPTSAPFSSGQGWGRGFLLGGWLAFFTLWAQSRALERGTATRALSSLALCGAIVAASVPPLWMRGAVIDALLGAALGWAAVSLLWLLGIDAAQGETSEESNEQRHLILLGAAFAATVLSAAALGVYRDFVQSDVTRGTHPALVLALAASVALSAILGALFSAIAPRATAPVSALVGIAVPPGAGYLLATRFRDDLGLFATVAIGLALGALLWLLARDEALGSEANEGESAARLPISAVLVALGAFMLAFQLRQGLGVALMLLAAWPTLLLALPASFQTENATALRSRSGIAQTLLILASFGAILLLSRLFATRFRADLRGASLDDPFTLFGFVAGATLPFLLLSLWFETRQSHSRSLWRLFPGSATPPRLFCLGVLGFALVGAMVALWGAKIAPAFLIGLALCALGFRPAALSRIRPETLSLSALSLGLLICGWTPRFLPLSEASRAARLQSLLWGTGGVIALFLVVDYGARLVAWLRRAPQTGIAS